MTICEFSDAQTHRYLSGSAFSESITFAYRFTTPLRSRMEILLELCAGMRILHIGCCDHIPLLPQKIAAGTWLHGRLTEVSSKCVGIDIDLAAIKQAAALSGLKNLFFGDIVASGKIAYISEETFDYAILGEVVEHIGNPVHFLQSFVSNYKSNFKRLIVTVPSALRAGNIKQSLRSRENINSDHRFFFTPYTLAKVMWDAGLTPVSIQMAHFSPAGRLKKMILNRYPLLAENIIYIGVSRS